MTVLTDPGDLVICGTCHTLRGPTPEYLATGEQLCACVPVEERRAQEKWKFHDFNSCAELCRCCGLVLLMSGSRWHSWFCGDCRERVKEVNQAVGRYLIPVGRHSMHNHVRVSAASPRAEDIAALVSVTHRIADGMTRLEAYRADLVGDLMKKFGFDRAADLRLEDYLNAVEASGLVADEEAVRGIVAWMLPGFELSALIEALIAADPGKGV